MGVTWRGGSLASGGCDSSPYPRCPVLPNSHIDQGFARSAANSFSRWSLEATLLTPDKKVPPVLPRVSRELSFQSSPTLSSITLPFPDQISRPIGLKYQI